jgi:hypothetical protein
MFSSSSLSEQHLLSSSTKAKDECLGASSFVLSSNHKAR